MSDVNSDEDLDTRLDASLPAGTPSSDHILTARFPGNKPSYSIFYRIESDDKPQTVLSISLNQQTGLKVECYVHLPGYFAHGTANGNIVQTKNFPSLPEIKLELEELILNKLPLKFQKLSA